jgi:CheY-like chemotaxis protein
MHETGSEQGLPHNAAKAKRRGRAGQPVRQLEPRSHSIHVFVNWPLTRGQADKALLVPTNCGPLRFSLMSVPPIRKPPAHPQKKQQLRVLFAEDDPAAQLIVRTLLEKHGYVMVLTRNGGEALARFQAEPFDLVLTDLHMPEMDGVALTDALRSLEADTGVHVPIIGVSANTKPGDREQCLAVGMDGFVPKPILPRVMLAEIERVLGSRAGKATGTET